MNKRVHEIAKERGIPAKEVLAKLQAAGIEVTAASSSVDEQLAGRVLSNGDAAASGGDQSTAPRATAAGSEQSTRPRTAASDSEQPARPTLRRVRIDGGGAGGSGRSGSRSSRASSSSPRTQAPAPVRPATPPPPRRAVPVDPRRAAEQAAAKAGGGGRSTQAVKQQAAAQAREQAATKAREQAAAQERAEQQRQAQERAAQERLAQERAAQDKVTQERAETRAAEAAAQERARAAVRERAQAKAAEAAAAQQAAQPSATGSAEPAASEAEAPARPQGEQAARRPTRDSLQGERAPGNAGGRRRVVIDSQASRRAGGPGGGPGGGPNQPPRRQRRGRRRRGVYDDEAESKPSRPLNEQPTTIQINSGSTVKDVAEYLNVSTSEIIKKLMALGEMRTLTQTLSDDTIELLAVELGKEVEIVHAEDEEVSEPVFDDAEDELVERAPVVTIMGHVDHGKTSLLDAIRETSVAAGEAGGITQHIGAYQVEHDGHTVTFLDTPGHEAFTAMRARGAKITDLAVIVVAADDGVKPQTQEAVDHAKEAGVPMLVAVNKIDKEGAQPDRVRTEMTQLGLQPVEWGGDTEFVNVSAKTREGLDDVLETIILMAEVEDLKANPDAPASGTVIESKLDPGRGPVVTILVSRGTLEVGDALVAGASWGRVRAMHDYLGNRVSAALPGQPVEVLGFDGVPEAGEHVRAVEHERRARQLAAERATRLKAESLARVRTGKANVTLESIFGSELQELNLVVKADVAGSLEAIEDEIAKLPQDEVSVNVIRRAVGGVTESDVMLAAASQAVILAFNVRPVGDARSVAEREGVEIRAYSVIYRAIDELRQAMQGMLAPEEVEEALGTAEVRQIFRASRVGTIAGSYVTDGTISRGSKVRLVRDGTVIWSGEIASLRRFNDDVREVATNFECGIVLRDYSDVKEGDVLETYTTRQVERELA
ncbi:MAG TPA: translation initiation factor IF-2 [Solirubrobacteraceae bacterium]|nr:translation initiation factor IF-2 [Solirubrobacteraceae bacterium]